VAIPIPDAAPVTNATRRALDVMGVAPRGGVRVSGVRAQPVDLIA
jgi:hypothetical protein